MRKLVLFGLVLAVAGLAVVPSVTAGPGRNALLAAMSGEQERPAGDPDGFGAAAFEIRGRRVCYRIIVGEIDPATAAHIHRGRAGEVGDIVVPLFTRGTTPARTRCVSTTRALARAILRRPGRFYVNVHNAAFPGGAVRGQLTK